MSGVISLDNISSTTEEQSGNNADSNSDQELEGDAGVEDLREACELVGADFDHVLTRVMNDSSLDAKDLINFMQNLSNDDELWESQEQYRCYSDIHRIKTFHLQSRDEDRTKWSQAFYGDSDDPSEGTYNWYQQRSRDLNGNLYWYRAIFPEPVEEHFPGNPVVWQERPDDDTDIFVTEEFMEEYEPYAIEIDGEMRPVPPTDEQAGSGSSPSDSDAIDPREMTVDEIKDSLTDLSESELEQLLEVEEATKDRKTAKEAIRREIESSESDESDDDEETVTVTIDGKEVTGAKSVVMEMAGAE